MLLTTLAGMVVCHPATQQLFMEDDGGLIRLLFMLEPIPTAMSIGEYAKQILENAQIAPSVCAAKIDEIRQELSDTAQRRAKLERERAVREQTGISRVLEEMMDGLDEQGWECCICKEGYNFCPEEVLGVYVYNNRISGIINTATYFVTIHFQCHDRATRADPDPRHNEWGAAKIRNSERPCNHIFPLPSATLKPGQYWLTLVRYLDEIRSGVPLDNFQIIVMDIRQHFLTLSAAERIPLEAGGGSLGSIMSFLPFLIYAGHVVLDEGTCAERQRAGSTTCSLRERRSTRREWQVSGS
jgi:hypothetical protein